MIKIAFIGSGNVAWHLSQALENAGHPVVEVYSRNPQHAASLVGKLYDAAVRPSLDFSDSEARLFFLCVSDDVMELVASRLVLPPDSIVVHTSGSKSMEELEYALTAPEVSVGVFYPLQTFSTGKPVSFASLPLCIEAQDRDTETLLVEIAQSLSQIVYTVSSEERRILHVSAVFACNFTNYLLTIAKRIVEKEQLDFLLLKPLIEETIRKALAAEDPAFVQTGPARRKDTQIIRKQLAYLQDYPEAQAIYQLLTENIMKEYGA